MEFRLCKNEGSQGKIWEMGGNWNGLYCVNGKATVWGEHQKLIVADKWVGFLLWNCFYSNNREGNGTPLQYSCLANPMGGEAWWAAVHGVAKSQTQLSNFTFTFHLHALEKEMATHSSVLAWRIPGMGEPGGLPSMGSHRVGHDWSDLAAVAAASITVANFMNICWIFEIKNLWEMFVYFRDGRLALE